MLVNLTSKLMIFMACKYLNANNEQLQLVNNHLVRVQLNPYIYCIAKKTSQEENDNEISPSFQAH